MRIIRDLETVPSEYRGGILSIGKFDGVHRGHGSILERLKVCSADRRRPSLVFTFTPSPAEILRPHLAPPLLCTTQRKIELISQYEPDALILFPTTREFLKLTAREFFEKIIVDLLDAHMLVEGDSFNFGCNRGGNTEVLRSLCEEYGRLLRVVPPVHVLGRGVSSSRIRSLIREGQVEVARGMLGRPYGLSGFVIQGEHRGRRLGFPTANLGGVATIVPKPGLYAALARHGDQTWGAAVHLGGNPTFGVAGMKIEAHLLDFQGDLYGEFLNLEFIARIRDVIPFSDEASLLKQIQKDITNIRRVLLMNKLEGLYKV
ncbi:MAG: riboflavin biosynthesis protein RibF [Planctomycetia bacterium]|nr:riboflavin biosynthesis protein RibF [Planctomycetia bacterium]